jgi:D-3-phosphoglycerate dehydrogenase / 2-oxoglutarate reductase
MSVAPEETPVSPPRPVIAVSVASLGEEDVLQRLVGERAEIRIVDLSAPQLIAEATSDADAVVMALQPMTAANIAALGPNVRVIGRAGVGLDTVDLDAAAAAGIAVVHEPTYSTNEVAHHAAALILALVRQVVRADRLTRESAWCSALELSAMLDLQASTLGVVGLGRIGSTIARLVGPFFSRTVGFDPQRTPAGMPVERLSSLDELLATSDVVTLHLPLNETTRNLIGSAELSAARRGILLVNVSRGGLIDEQALIAAIKTGQVAGAALDVFAQEPLPSESGLRSFNNVILTPHLAGTSEGASDRVAKWMLEDILAHLGQQPLPYGRHAVDTNRGDRRTTTTTP